MDNKLHHEMVKKATKGKFAKSNELVSRTVPKYPDTAEREFKRITNAYMKLLKESLEEHLPVMMKEYKIDKYGNSRNDGFRDIEDIIRREIQKIADELEQKIARFNLETLVGKIAKMTQKKSLREWKNVVKKTLGIDLMDDYYSGDFYADALKKWVDDNVIKIKSMPKETLGNMREIILNGYKQGRTIRDITKDIQSEYGATKKKAQALARDQIGSLNSQITQMQQTNAGCKKYRWSTSGDSRVRECHNALDDQIISWDDPPEMWYRTKKGIVHTGRRCHPGEDYLCRCVAIPVFDEDTVDVPMKEA